MVSLTNQIASIPQIFRAILTGFLVILTLRITSPITDNIFAIFPAGQMRVAALLGYWLVVLFVTWFLMWALIFQPNKQAVAQGGGSGG